MKVYGLIGERLGHSLSPTIHQSLFQKMNISATYGLFEVPRDEVQNIVSSMKCLGIRGLNVTIPYKEDVIAQVDELSPEAQKIGAINTLYNDDKKVIGYNTDYIGFGKIVKKSRIEVENQTFYVLGSGGSSKSVIWYLKDHGATVIVVTRNKADAKEKLYKEDVEIIDYDDLCTVSEGYALVNTTPCGMYPDTERMAIEAHHFSKFKVAIDIVYNPIETLFLQTARHKNLKVAGGLWMLVAQAMASEGIWQQTKMSEDYEEAIYKEVEKLITKK